MEEIRIGDRLVFVPEDRGNLVKRGKGEVPEQHEIVIISGIRAYEKIGFCISLEGYDSTLFIPLAYFQRPDLEFAENIIKKLFPEKLS